MGQTSRFFGGTPVATVDVLRPGDVALCTTRAYIRPIHVELNYDSPTPVRANDDGYFPAPVANDWTEL